MEIAYEVSSIINNHLVVRAGLLLYRAAARTVATRDDGDDRSGLHVIVNRLTAHFTSKDEDPSRKSQETRFGPATTILSGLAEGYESSTLGRADHRCCDSDFVLLRWARRG